MRFQIQYRFPSPMGWTLPEERTFTDECAAYEWREKELNAANDASRKCADAGIALGEAEVLDIKVKRLECPFGYF